MSSHQTVLVVGPPNAGKSSLFNHLTGVYSRIVNYPGSTVDCQMGRLEGASHITILDTPGIVSVVPQTKDEEVTIQTLRSPQTCNPTLNSCPDLVIAVCDATQLTRHLVLVHQLTQIGFRVVIVVTMTDLLIHPHGSVDFEHLSKRLNLPIFTINNRTRDGISDLRRFLATFSPHSTTVKTNTLTNTLPCPIEDSFLWADEMVQPCLSPQPMPTKRLFDWDRVLLNPLGGPIVFLCVMSIFFWSIFSFATPFIDAVDTLFIWTIEILNSYLPDVWATRFLLDGVITGIGAFMVFIPQISILFFGLSILESSGYLARGAVLIDKPLSAIGLSGRCFVPLLSGCACAIPAMMAARTIPGKKQRMITLFVIPLMSCTARLPVYGLLLALLLPHNPLWQGIAMTGIYFLSIALTGLIAGITSRFLFKETTNDYFHIELPSWKRPLLKKTLKSVWDQTMQFVKNAGPIITLASTFLWLSSVWPSENAPLIHYLGQWMTPLLEPMGLDWRVGVALIASFAAREVFVTALAILFASGDDSVSSLIAYIKSATFSGSDQLIFTTGSSIGLLLFFMIALQCMSTVAIAKKEMGGWKWPLIMVITYLGLGYMLAVLSNWMF